MKTFRSSFAAVLWSLLGAIASSTLPGSHAIAQGATTRTATAALVPVKGIVDGAPESVRFSGQAQLNANVVTDPDFGNPPNVVLSIDLSRVTGVGSMTGQKYVTSNQEILTRPLTSADMVQITFPFHPSGGSEMASRVGLVSFHLSFNVNTLKLTKASGTIENP